MVRSRISPFVLFLLVTCAISSAADPRVMLSVGHAGPVRAAVGHPTEPIAFTVGDDGRLLVWDLETQSLRYRYQISPDPITMIAHHPTRDEVALVVNDGVGESRIEVVEWETGEVVFSRTLDNTPVHMTYSPSGTFLIFTLPTFQSLYFLTSDRGTARSYLDDGFGIVSFTQMGRSEQAIMTYLPARGEFIYWNLQSGDEIQRVATLTRLQHLTLVDPENRRAIAAASGSDLVIVDNVSGEIWARYPVSPIHDISFDPDSRRILVLTENLGRRTVLSFTYQSGRLSRSFFRPAVGDNALFITPLPGGASIAGNPDGAVDLFDRTSGRKTALGPRPIVPIRDVAFTEGRMHVSLGDRILSLVSDMFRTTGTRLEVTTIRQTQSTMGDTSIALLASDQDDVLVWGDPATPGTIYRIQPPGTGAEPYYEDAQKSPVFALRSTEAGPVIVHRDGRVVHLAEGAPVPRYTYPSRGAQAADWSVDLGLVIAKTRSSNFDSSIIRVDQLTGETVPIRSDAFLATDVAFGGNGELYAIGLYGSPGSPATRLTRYSGRDLERETVLMDFNGEDSSATVVWDDETGRLYTTLGYSGLLRIDGLRTTRMDATGQIARVIHIAGLYIAAVNADGSVSLWNRYSGEFLFDLYAIEGGAWVAMNEDGAFYASSRSVERYLDFVSERRTRLDLNDFRIELPYRE